MSARPFDIITAPDAPLTVDETARKYRLSRRQSQLVKAFLARHVATTTGPVDSTSGRAPTAVSNSGKTSTSARRAIKPSKKR